MVLRFVREVLLVEIYNGYGSNGKALCDSTGLLVGISFYGSRSGGTTVCKGAGELSTREALLVKHFSVN